MSDEALVRAALHATFGAPITPAELARGENAVRAAAAAHAAGETADTPKPPVAIGRPQAHLIPGRAAAAVLAAVLTIGTPGLAAAATNAGPGDGLYPVKLVVEQLWSAAAPGSAATARVHLRLAIRRIDELEALPDPAPAGTRERLLGSAEDHLDHAERLNGAAMREAVIAVRARLATLTQPRPAQPPAVRRGISPIPLAPAAGPRPPGEHKSTTPQGAGTEHTATPPSSRRAPTSSQGGSAAGRSTSPSTPLNATPSPAPAPMGDQQAVRSDDAGPTTKDQSPEVEEADDTDDTDDTDEPDETEGETDAEETEEPDEPDEDQSDAEDDGD